MRALYGRPAAAQSPHPLLLVLGLLLSVMETEAQGRVASRQEFCGLCTDHTVCLYPGVGANCNQGRFVRGVSASEQRLIVDLHNEMRNLVATGQERRGSPGPQPSAANMERMEWDVEVAFVAQRWADQCTYRHDNCRNVPDAYVGQNIYLRSQWPVSAMDDEANWTEPIYAWYDEVALMAGRAVDSYQGGEDIGHYTQIVWATTNRIGCGYTLFQDGDWAKKYYVCDYKPGGNVVGQQLYQRGPPRSACPSSSGDTGSPDPAYPGLCGSPRGSPTGSATATASASAPTSTSTRTDTTTDTSSPTATTTRRVTTRRRRPPSRTTPRPTPRTTPRPTPRTTPRPRNKTVVDRRVYYDYYYYDFPNGGMYPGNDNEPLVF